MTRAGKIALIAEDKHVVKSHGQSMRTPVVPTLTGAVLANVSPDQSGPFTSPIMSAKTHVVRQPW